MTQRSFFRPWYRATVFGWLLGIMMIVVLALLAEMFGQHSLHTPVGAGMGLALGFFQSRVIRKPLGKAMPWFWSCFLGLSLPFFVADVVRAMDIDLPYSLYIAVTACGLVLGLWQSVLLRPVLGAGASAWVGISLLGWLLASGAVALADLLFRTRSVPGIAGAVSYLGLVAGGGILLALTTGRALARRFPVESANRAH